MQTRLLPYLTTETRREAFDRICDATLDACVGENGIGTLGEKSIHAVLKNFYAPHDQQEIRFAGFVADIKTDEGITEIQTRNFNVLRRKLEAFLAQTPVTIVYPVVYRKWLRWVDPMTGQITKPRKSPLTNYGFRIFPELYRIKPFVLHPALSVRLVLLDVEEYKMLDGYGPSRKKRASRNDGFPTALIAEIPLRTPDDYRYFLPPSLPNPFSTKEFAAAAKVTESLAQVSVHMLAHLGTITPIGKEGRRILYRT